MSTIIVSTTVDPNRVGLTYRVDLPEWAVNAWWEDSKEIQVARRSEWSLLDPEKMTYQDANTTISIFREDGTTEVHLLALTLAQLNAVLAKADNDYSEVEGRQPGRPTKKVLLMTTSKDRRMGMKAGY